MTDENGGVAEREWNLEVFTTDTGIEPFSVFADELEAPLDAALRVVLAVRGLGLVRIPPTSPFPSGQRSRRPRDQGARQESWAARTTRVASRRRASEGSTPSRMCR